jgi:hypothetical protein
MSMRLLFGFCFASALAMGESWTGVLVDSKCYAAEERNVNPTDTSTAVDTDKSMEIRRCSPKAKTNSFAIIRPEGQVLQLDAGGNAKAAGLVRTSGRKAPLRVALTGEMSGQAVKVGSISLVK